MAAHDLSILIPARNEEFLTQTIEDLLKNIEADTEIIVALDGYDKVPPLPDNERVNTIVLQESIGQRASTNLACKLSQAKYVMKVDAHCSFDKGFDRKMLEAFEKVDDLPAQAGNVTMVPVMRNLWAFDWKCVRCGKKWYQGPTPTECKETNYKNTGKPCDGDKFIKKLVWIGKHNPQSTSYCFDPTPHFQYFEDWKHRPAYEKDKNETGLTETMSLQGSCFMLTREKYWELNICDEDFGGWGSQGIEVAAKTWLSGGRVLVNHNTWYAHMFRTQGGDFSFPYPMSGKQQKNAQKYARSQFFEGKWEGQKKPLSWLVKKFWPVKGWEDEDLKKLLDLEKKDNLVLRGKSLVQKLNERQPQTTEIETKQIEENTIQIQEGNNNIFIDITKIPEGETKSKNPNYVIEPSQRGLIYTDAEIRLKIRIEKSK